MIGQEKILNKLKSYTITTLPKNLLFLGPYGSGKHTIAREVAKYYGVDIIELSVANFEDEKLIEEFKSGLTIRQIAEIHNRKPGGIRARLKKHNLIE